MSLIDDVREEVRGLDLSAKRLRRFGLTVGGVFFLLSALAFFKGAHPYLRYFPIFVGILLIAFGYSYPEELKSIYKAWMGGAFTIGWIVSRIMLTVLFYIVITPIGLIARLFGKKFMAVDMRKRQDSCWLKRDRGKR